MYSHVARVILAAMRAEVSSPGGAGSPSDPPLAEPYGAQNGQSMPTAQATPTAQMTRPAQATPRRKRPMETESWAPVGSASKPHRLTTQQEVLVAAGAVKDEKQMTARQLLIFLLVLSGPSVLCLFSSRIFGKERQLYRYVPTVAADRGPQQSPTLGKLELMADVPLGALLVTAAHRPATESSASPQSGHGPPADDMVAASASASHSAAAPNASSAEAAVAPGSGHGSLGKDPRDPGRHREHGGAAAERAADHFENHTSIERAKRGGGGRRRRRRL